MQQDFQGESDCSIYEADAPAFVAFQDILACRLMRYVGMGGVEMGLDWVQVRAHPWFSNLNAEVWEAIPYLEIGYMEALHV